MSLRHVPPKARLGRASAAVQKTGVRRRPVRAPDPRAPQVLITPLTGEVDASTCEQSGARQSVGGTLVGEKNRCVRINTPGACAAPFTRRVVRAGGDNFRDNRGKSGVPVTRLSIRRFLAAVRWPSG